MLPGTPITISKTVLRNFLALVEKEKGHSQPTLLGIKIPPTIPRPYMLPFVPPETNYSLEFVQTTDPAQLIALSRPFAAPGPASPSQPFKSVVHTQPPRPRNLPALRARTSLSAAIAPQFLNKHSVYKSPDLFELCLGVLPPQPSVPPPLHTSQGIRLTHHLLVDLGTRKHILHSLDLVLNARDHHQAVAGFAGNHSRSTHKGDLVITLKTTAAEIIEGIMGSGVKS